MCAAVNDLLERIVVAEDFFSLYDDVSGGGEQNHNLHPASEKINFLIVVIRTMYTTAGKLRFW